MLETGVMLRPDAVVLASASRSRAMLLQQAGLMIGCDPADIDEDAVKSAVRAEGGAAIDVARRLARQKAETVSLRHGKKLVVGADQMLACDGRWFDKPAGPAQARAHLQALRGRTHSLISAVAVATNGAILWDHVAEAQLTMRAFDDAFIDVYLALVGDDVLASVGAYQMEGVGVQLFERIEGDYFTILGLPLLPLLDFLRSREVLRS